jgi:hypothetical protein
MQQAYRQFTATVDTVNSADALSSSQRNDALSELFSGIQNSEDTFGMTEFMERYTSSLPL